MTPREFERKCIENFKKRIRLPERNYQVINRDNRRFCYLFDNEIRYIIFPTPQQFTEFLIKNDLIKKRFEVDYYIRRSFKMKVVVEETKWNEVIFSEDEIIELAARKEYESIGGMVGYCSAKIIPFTTIIAA